MQKTQQHIGREYLQSVGYREVKPYVFELRKVEFEYNKWLKKDVRKMRLLSRIVMDGTGKILSQIGTMPIYSRINRVRRGVLR